MNKKKRVVALLLVTVMVLAMIPVFSFATVAKENSAGTADRWIKQDLIYETKKVLEQAPVTLEAMVKLTHRANPQQGVIFGSYVDDSTPSISFGIGPTGRPWLKVVSMEKKVTEFQFGNAYSLTRNAYTHMTFVIDTAAGEARYYNNGTLEDTVKQDFGTLPTDLTYRVGGDKTVDNANWFKGAIHWVAAYGDVRTPEEITADYAAIDYTAEGMIGAWNLAAQGDNALTDRSGNGKTLSVQKGEGILIDTHGTLSINQTFEAAPETVEAWIYLPQCYYSRGGTLIGNYPKTPYFAFEIKDEGNPSFFYQDVNGGSATHTFTNIDVRKSDWVHVAFVHDAANGVAHCYINGELAQTLEGAVAYNAKLTDNYSLFGADRQGAAQRFGGYIKELRLYSDVRSATEVASDYAGNVDYTDAAILAHYQPTEEYADIEDLSGNGYNVKYNQIFWSEVPPVEDYAYSLAIVGDTQGVSNFYPDKLDGIYDWIIDNKDEKKIQYVFGVGDITEYDSDAEWTAAKAAITKLDGVLPYSLVRGQGHDTVAQFDTYFAGHTGYTSQIDGYYKEGSVANTYQTFTIGETDYLVLALDMGVPDDVIAWAKEVIEAHPMHKVIITTHAYLEADGSYLEAGESYCPSAYDRSFNNGDQIWEKLASKYPNIYMVLCGHISSDDVVVSTAVGDYGNEVTQILVNPDSLDSRVSGGVGMVAILYFSEDGSEVSVEYYSTIRDQWRPNKHFTITEGITVEPSYEYLDENYIIVQNKETNRYRIVKNTYFEFLGGALRYADATDGYANIRFGYRFDAGFDLMNSNWKWYYGVSGNELSNCKFGEKKTSANISNLVITDVPQSYYVSSLEVRLQFDVKIDGVAYTVIDRVRSRSVLGVATAMAQSAYESGAARTYAQGIVDACNG